MKYLGALLLLPLSVSTMLAQNARPVAVREFPQYQLIKGNVDSDGLPTSGAKLCIVEPAQNCFQIPSNEGYSGGGAMYDYGLDPHAEKIPIGHGGSIVLFSARFSGGGSGSLDSLTLLRYEDDGNITSLLPFLGLSEQSDRTTWHIRGLSDYPILLTADYDWMKDESHYARHFYIVSAYCFDHRADRYLRVFRYKTSKKYASLDDVETVRVIEPERNEIMRRLKAASMVAH